MDTPWLAFSPLLGSGLLSLGIVTLSTPSAIAQTDAYDIPAEPLATARGLIERGLRSELAWDIVSSLTTTIGPRLAGSDAEARARGWGARLGEELGFDRVSVETFAMPFWERGHPG